MNNTIFHNVLCNFASICKTHILSIIFNNKCVIGKVLTLNKITNLRDFLNRNIKIIVKSLILVDEY
jgi:hypothetical protein